MTGVQPDESGQGSSAPADGGWLFRVGEFVVDLRNERVTLHGAELTLPRLSFDLLAALVRAAPYVVTTDRLMEAVWPHSVVGADTVAQRVKLLRDMLGDAASDPKYIETVRGRGYRLLAKVVALPDSPAATDRTQAHARWRSSPGRLAIGGISTLAAGIAIFGGFFVETVSKKPADSVPAVGGNNSASLQATRDTEAYSVYVEALATRIRAAGVYGRSEDQIRLVEALLTNTLERDPEFAAAYAERVGARIAMFQYNVDTSQEHLQSIREDLAAATSLAPEAPKTLAAISRYELFVDRDLDRGVATFNAALDAGLADPRWMFDVAVLLAGDGRIDEAMALTEHALAISPGSEVSTVAYSKLLSQIRRPREALRLVDVALEQSPRNFALRRQRGLLMLGWRGSADALFGALDDSSARPAALSDPGWSTRFALLRMRFSPGSTAVAEQPEDGAEQIRAIFSGVGPEPIARYRGWISMLQNDLPAAAEAGRQIIAFLSATPASQYNQSFRKLLEAEAHTFGLARADAVAAAREVVLAFGDSPEDTADMRLAIATVLAWNGEQDRAVGILTDLTTGIPAIPPGMITRDALIATPLSGHAGYRALTARLDAVMAASDID